MGRDHVHVAFDDDRLALLSYRVACPIDRVEGRTLLENLRLRRVDVLGHRIIESPSPEPDVVRALVLDWDDQAPPEHWRCRAIVALPEQAGGEPQEAQRRPARLEAKPLAEAADYIERYRRDWEEAFGRLDEYLKELQEKAKEGSDDAGQ